MSDVAVVDVDGREGIGPATDMLGGASANLPFWPRTLSAQLPTPKVLQHRPCHIVGAVLHEAQSIIALKIPRSMLQKFRD